MPALVGILSDGAVYYQDGDDWVWIPSADAFTALGFDWGAIDWEDTLPSPSSDPYQASDNPSGDAPPPQESPNPEPAPPPDQTAPAAPTVTLPLWVGLPGPDGPGSAGSPIYLLVGGVYRYVPDAATFAALGGSLSVVTWLDSLPGPQGADLASSGPPTVTTPIGGDGPPVALDPLQYGFFQPTGSSSGVGIASRYGGNLTVQGAWGGLIDALSGDLYNGILSGQIWAGNLAQAVI